MTERQTEQFLRDKQKMEVILAKWIRLWLCVSKNTPIDSKPFYKMSSEIISVFEKLYENTSSQ